MFDFLLLASTLGDFSDSVVNITETVAAIIGLAALVANFFKPGSPVGRVIHILGANGPAIQSAMKSVAQLTAILGTIEDEIREELAKPSPDMLKVGFMQAQVNQLKSALPPQKE